MTPPGNYQSGAVLTSAGKVCAVAYNLTSNLVCFSFVSNALDDDWSVGVGGIVSKGIAVDAQGNLVTGSGDAKVHKTTPAGATTPIATVDDDVSDSPIILATGHIVVGDLTGALHKLTSAGGAAWTPPPNLGGVPLAPLALDDGTLVAATQNGKVHALAPDGSTRWSVTFTGNPTLRGANVSLPSGTPATSTAYFSAANGKVYAVVVDGTLDTAAPWPKAFRDRRNRSNASLP